MRNLRYITPPPNSIKMDNNFTFKDEIRDFKLNMILNEIEFKFNDSIVKEHSFELNFLYNNFPTAAISGSFALKLFGGLNREIGDIDMVIDKSNVDFVVTNNDIYNSIKDYIGYKSVSFKRNIFTRSKKYKIDFFAENYSAEYKELILNDFVSIKVETPISVILKKIEIINSMGVLSSEKHKHYEDIIDFLK